ncbi:MAG: M48 family metalloprotease, partial [Muribaculaceae bacterium]|nr:M48 family metalloprotease [Muribaculaceae bacterium]
MKLSKLILSAALIVAAGTSASAQFNLGKAVKAGSQVVQALTVTDEQMAAYAKESVDWMDTHNKVSDPDSEYTKRLNRLTEGLTEADGLPLNFKVYEVIDVNAFACPDGSVRVFSSLMDIMSDEELLGVIGHEIGHEAKHHSKKGFKQSLLTG